MNLISLTMRQRMRMKRHFNQTQCMALIWIPIQVINFECFLKLWQNIQNIYSFKNCIYFINILAASGLGCSTWADQGSNMHPLHWKCRFLTTGAPGKS